MDSDIHTVGQAMEHVMERFDQKELWLPRWVPTPASRRYPKAIAALEQVVYRMIAEREAGGVDLDDLLSMHAGAG